MFDKNKNYKEDKIDWEKERKKHPEANMSYTEFRMALREGKLNKDSKKET